MTTDGSPVIQNILGFLLQSLLRTRTVYQVQVSFIADNIRGFSCGGTTEKPSVGRLHVDGRRHDSLFTAT